jgi:hypothetical protein
MLRVRGGGELHRWEVEWLRIVEAKRIWPIAQMMTEVPGLRTGGAAGVEIDEVLDYTQEALNGCLRANRKSPPTIFSGVQ